MPEQALVRRQQAARVNRGGGRGCAVWAGADGLAVGAGEAAIGIADHEEDAAASAAGKAGTSTGGAGEAAEGAPAAAAKSVRYGPHNPGPLDDAIASTFRSSSYTKSELSEPTTLYRAYGGKAGKLGSYWSRTKPSGPPSGPAGPRTEPGMGNPATSVATIRVPAGTTIYEGAAASQPIAGGDSLLGGGGQVSIPRVSPSWIVP